MDLAKNKPEFYNILSEIQPTLPTIEKCIANEGYASFEQYMNDPADLPDELLCKATWTAVRPMKLMLKERPDFNEVKEAMMVHQVHLPGNELLKIRQVEVLEDCCTDVIQKQLDEGWKIIAVCPQSSRRPDYILGKM